MVKGKKTPKAPSKNRMVIPPESWTGYPPNKPTKCPAEILRKTIGGGKRAS